MTPLRQRMIEDMQLRGFSPKTQEAYLRAVRQLAEHFGRSPADLTEEDLRQYFLYLKNEKHASRSTCTQILCGIKFLYEHTLKREWATLELVRPPKEKKLPVVLSQEEVSRVLSCLKSFRHHVCLSTIYSCGLRLREGVQLQVADLERRKGSLRPAARSDSGPAAAVLANPSPSALDLPCTNAPRGSAFEGRHAHLTQQCAEGASDGMFCERPAEARHRAYLAALLCHPSAGGGSQSAAYSSLSGTHVPEEHVDLYASDP